MIDRRIKFRHLQCFLAVARQRSVVKAAAELSVTQPAVSKTLRELEEILAVRLLDRNKKGTELTAFGAVFLEHASASVTALRQGLDSVAQSRARGESTITVGALPTVAARVMPEATRRYLAEGAGPTLRIVTGPNTMLIGRLRGGELDLVVGRLAAPDLMTGLAFEHLYSERIVLVVRPDHPLLRGHPVDLEQLRALTVLMPSTEDIIRPTVDRLLIANRVGVITTRIETVSDAFGRRFVRESDAVWIISQGVVATDLAEGTLAELAVDTRDTLGPVGLTTRAVGAPSPAVAMLMRAIRGVAKALRDHVGHS